VLVDPGILRACAGQVDIAAVHIGAVDLGDKTSSAGDAPLGPTTRMTRLFRNLTMTGRVIRGAGDTVGAARLA
jgi:hypothetical protein